MLTVITYLSCSLNAINVFDELGRDLEDPRL